MGSVAMERALLASFGSLSDEDKRLLEFIEKIAAS